MKKQAHILSVAILLGSIALLGSCAKSGLFLRGGQISFGTIAGEVGTRTEYGDDYTADGSTTTWQLINWETGDYISIVSAESAVSNDGSGEHIAHYLVTEVTTPYNNHQSKATVTSTPNGLCWKEGYTGKYNFYAVYPKPADDGAVTAISYPAAGDATDDETNVGVISANLPAAPTMPDAEDTPKYVKADGTITTTASEAAYSYTVYKPDMDYAIMSAAATNISESNDKPQVNLLFKPAFTAFEINLTSQDENFSVSEISLNAGAEATNTDYLAGGFSFKAGANFDADESPVTVADDASKSVTITPAEALPITTSSGLSVTLFTIPVKNTGMLTLKIKTTSGTASLNLTAAGSTAAYQFLPGRKYRINMLKLGGKFTYYITLSPQAMPWNLVDKETTFADQVQADKFKITGSTDDENHYLSNDVTLDDEYNAAYAQGEDSQAYKDFMEAHPGYDWRRYQIRYLDTSNSEIEPYFEVRFRPIAPLGGYWRLETVGDIGSFRVVVWDEAAEEDDPDNYDGSTDLSGQIMNNWVTLRIYPYPSLDDLDPTQAHAIYFHAIFATDSGFENFYNADSEIQDAHKDGTFSYWYFLIPANE